MYVAGPPSVGRRRDRLGCTRHDVFGRWHPTVAPHGVSFAGLARFCLADSALSRVAAWGRCGSAMQSHAGVSRSRLSCRPSLSARDSRLHHSNLGLVTKVGDAGGTMFAPDRAFVHSGLLVAGRWGVLCPAVRAFLAGSNVTTLSVWPGQHTSATWW